MRTCLSGFKLPYKRIVRRIYNDIVMTNLRINLRKTVIAAIGTAVIGQKKITNQERRPATTAAIRDRQKDVRIIGIVSWIGFPA